MGWVDKWSEYRRVQATIQECAAEAGVPAIAFRCSGVEQEALVLDVHPYGR